MKLYDPRKNDSIQQNHIFFLFWVYVGNTQLNCINYNNH